MQILYLFLAGACGALVKDVLQDNCIVLPDIKNHTLTLGFLGAMIVGGFVGWAVDGSLLVAALSGFVGYQAIEDLLPRKSV